MFALIYLSTAQSGLSSSELGSIITSSVKNNWNKEITGVLIYLEGMFFQVLEGPESHVRECFTRIEKDPRHKEVQLLDARETESRYFPDWGMAFQHLPEGIPGYSGIKTLKNLAEFETLFSQPQHVVHQWLQHIGKLIPMAIH